MKKTWDMKSSTSYPRIGYVDVSEKIIFKRYR